MFVLQTLPAFRTDFTAGQWNLSSEVHSHRRAVLLLQNFVKVSEWSILQCMFPCTFSETPRLNLSTYCSKH